MTTNQTIDGVPVFYAIDAPNAYPLEAGTLDRIERSDGALWVHLNGKRSKLIGLQSLDFLINQLNQIKGEVFGTEPAAQHQGEPAANPVIGYADSYRAMARQGVKTVSIWSVITDLERNIAPLYAKQAAPVAVVLPDSVSVDEFVDESMANGWNACLDEVKRLNP